MRKNYSEFTTPHAVKLMTGVCEVIQVLPAENLKEAISLVCYQPMEILKNSDSRDEVVKALAVLVACAKNLSVGAD